MSYKTRLPKGYAAAALIALTVILSIIHPRLNRANPIPEQVLITEFSVLPQSEWKIELLLRNMTYLESCRVETDYGIWEFRHGLDFPDTGFVVLTDSCFDYPLLLDDTGGFIRIFDTYFDWAVVYYGNHSESVVPSPPVSQSASAVVYIDPYDWLMVDYFYLDSSPTFGVANDMEGSFGIIRGTVTDSSTGMPVDGAIIMPSDSLNTAITDSDGSFELDVVSGFPTLCFTASGYNPHISDFRDIILHPDSAITYDVQLARGSGIESSETNGQAMPRSFSLSQNYPNPFNPSTNIHYEIEEGNSPGERMRLDIFDTRGRRVRTLVDTERSPGRYTVQWDGKDEFGRNVGSGVYLYRLKVGSYQSIKRMVVLK